MATIKIKLEDATKEQVIQFWEDEKDKITYPFAIRLYGSDKTNEFTEFKDGKKYSLEEIKDIVVSKYYEFEKAEFEYKQEHNEVFSYIGSSTKG